MGMNEAMKLIKGTCILVRARVDKCDVTQLLFCKHTKGKIFRSNHAIAAKKDSLENRLGNWSINNLIDQCHECRISLIGRKNETSFQERLLLILNS